MWQEPLRRHTYATCLVQAPRLKALGRVKFKCPVSTSLKGSDQMRNRYLKNSGLKWRRILSLPRTQADNPPQLPPVSGLPSRTVSTDSCYSQQECEDLTPKGWADGTMFCDHRDSHSLENSWNRKEGRCTTRLPGGNHTASRARYGHRYLQLTLPVSWILTQSGQL
ncbi:hypothetical protein CB1_001428003 [Camelus ferus]|nr:hypothetical protein CB1_001428003 [Camelus ferus]